MDKISKELDRGPKLLKDSEDNWRTGMGAWFPGERVVLKGKDIFTELENVSWIEYLLRGITDKNDEELSKLAKLIEGSWRICTSFPDPRLWNNRICALAGTVRSTGNLGIAAGMAVSEATIYGLKPIKGGMDFLFRAKNALKNGSTIEELVKAELKAYRVVPGYGRPVTDKDERIGPLLKFAKAVDANIGEYTNLAFQIEEYFLNSRYKYRMNASAITSSLLADAGLTPEEYYYTAIPCFLAGMIPCYIDSLNHPLGSFFPIPTTRLRSTGSHDVRLWKQHHE